MMLWLLRTGSDSVPVPLTHTLYITTRLCIAGHHTTDGSTRTSCAYFGEMTTLTFTAAVILLLCCAYFWRSGDCLSENCLFSRLDIIKCTPHRDTSQPGPNEYALYRTFIRNRVPDCIYRNPNANSDFEIIRPIDNLGNPNVRLLYSPGYLLNRKYANNLLVHYNVECPKGRLPFLVYNDLDLRDKECFTRCEDYVNVSCATCGTSENCGTDPTNNFYSLEQEHFSVTFRTSRVNNDHGFELSVICFDPINMNKPGCSTFGGIKKRDLEIYRNMWHKHAERTRRLVAPELGEPEFIPFPDRPTISTIFTFSTFPIRPTLPPPPPRVLREDVTLRDVVTYRSNTITVSRGGEVVRRIRNIARLVVRDASGRDLSFTRDAVELRPGGVKATIQLRGPGELLVFLSSATFLRDSQPFALSANEKEVLRALSKELFNLIPSSNDLNIADIDEEIQRDDPIELDPRITKPEFPTRLHPQRADVAPFSALPRQPVSTLAIRQSALFENSCNPVVKAASTSTLSIASRQSPFRVESVRQSVMASF